MKSALALTALFMLMAPASATDDARSMPSPSEIVQTAPRDEWKPIAEEDLLVMDLAPDSAGKPRRIIIRLLPPPFSQPWVENVRAIARARWWDEKSVYRVVDNFVAQWGGGDDEEAGFPPYGLPEGVETPSAPYTTDRPRDGLTFSHRDWSDPYAPQTGFRDGLPFAWDETRMWPVHCYGSVAVARDLPPDTGSGGELYAVIGNAPRSLDRNLAVVGRVIRGIEHLSTLPRGTGNGGVYEERGEDTPILSIRLASDLPDPPRFEYLNTSSQTFARYAAARVSRNDAFFVTPARPEDPCAIPVPIRPIED